MLNKKIKCPKCGSENVVCLDGGGAISKYGDNVMIDIAPDMWLCKDCNESVRPKTSELRGGITMNDTKKEQFDLKALAEDVVKRPAPESCEEIARLLQGLPLWSSFINTSPRPEQKRALELLKGKSLSPTAEEILFIAEIGCGKYHRIRRDGDFSCFNSEKALELYRQYYELTGSEEVKYILDNFDEFKNLCYKSIARRQRKDDINPYIDNSPLSTSRDPDSEEWKK